MSDLFVHESPGHDPVPANTLSLFSNILTLESQEPPNLRRLQVHWFPLDDLAEDLLHRPADLLSLLHARPDQSSLLELSQGGVGRLLWDVGISQPSKAVTLVVDKVLGMTE